MFNLFPPIVLVLFQLLNSIILSSHPFSCLPFLYSSLSNFSSNLFNLSSSSNSSNFFLPLHTPLSPQPPILFRSFQQLSFSRFKTNFLFLLIKSGSRKLLIEGGPKQTKVKNIQKSENVTVIDGIKVLCIRVKKCY